MNMPRRVRPETLDNLAADDPRMPRARRDLQLVNRIIGTRATMLELLQRNARVIPRRILELGAGDGTQMLNFAGRLARRWPAVRLTLLDRHHCVSAETIAAYRNLGWTVDTLAADVTDWIAQPADARWDLTLANLFLHHFDDRQVSSLLHAIARRSDAFFACEPRRAQGPLVGSRMLALIGCDAITREDAVASVRAGFRAWELSSMWPADERGWRLTEYSSRFFCHCFCATREFG